MFLYGGIGSNADLFYICRCQFKIFRMVAVRTSCTVADDHCKCFDALTEEQLELLEKKQVTVEYNKGEIIAKHRAFASHVIFLCEGLVKVYIEHGGETLILIFSLREKGMETLGPLPGPSPRGRGWGEGSG
jgi:hypothetical protein